MAEMQPEGVPAEFVRAAMAARWDLAYPDTACRSILAAVLPLHEQLLRKRLADEIRFPLLTVKQQDALEADDGSG